MFGEKDIDKGSYKEEFKVSINILERLTERKTPKTEKKYNFVLLFTNIGQATRVFWFTRQAPEFILLWF